MKDLKVILKAFDKLIKEKEKIISESDDEKEIKKAKKEKDLYELVKALLWFEFAFSKIVLDSIKFKKGE